MGLRKPLPEDLLTCEWPYLFDSLASQVSDSQRFIEVVPTSDW